MLVVRNTDYFARVVRFARTTGQLEHLTSVLWYLHTYAERVSTTPRTAPEPILEEGIPASWNPHATGSRCTCTLIPDFAPASWEVIWSIGMVGGLIYHGSQAGWHAEPGTHTDPLSVTIGHSDNPWRVHT